MPIIYKITDPNDRLHMLEDLAKRQWNNREVIIHDGLFEVFDRGTVQSIPLDQATIGFAQAILSGMFPELKIEEPLNPAKLSEEATMLLLEYIFGRR